MSPRHVERITTPPRVAVAPAAVLALLRAAVGSPLLMPLPDEDAATMGHPLPSTMAIDAGAWVAWCLAGLRACERLDLGQEPDGKDTSWIEAICETAKRMVTVLAMRRVGGNISHAAAGLRTSRRALRDRLKAANLHPWPRSPEPTQHQRLDALGLPRLAAAVLAMRPLVFVGPGEDATEAANDPGAPKAANGPGALAVVQALAAILERAEVLRMDGYDPLAAIARAMGEHRPDRDLECVVMAAWALAVGSDAASTSEGMSTTGRNDSNGQGGRA